MISPPNFAKQPLTELMKTQDMLPRDCFSRIPKWLLALIAATALVQRSNAAITPLQCTEQINYFSQNGRYDCPIHMCVDPFDDGGCNGCCAPGGASGSGSGASGNLPPSFSAGAAGGHGPALSADESALAARGGSQYC